jgi:ABC-type Na+ transport system ATPase subunit NatA
MIEVKKLVKRFGMKAILRGLDFRVERGEFVALLGPNGAGKTTFLRILSSLARPSMGEVRVAGYQLPNQAAAVRARLGVVSHMPLLYGDLTAEENLEFYARLYGIPFPATRISEVLQMVGLESRRRDLVRTFSRGMQQRLAIGRAVLHDPDVCRCTGTHRGHDLPRSSARRRPCHTLRYPLARCDCGLHHARLAWKKQSAHILQTGAGGVNMYTGKQVVTKASQLFNHPTTKLRN